MREALQVLYLKNDSSSLEDLLRMTQISVKTEVADHDEEHEFKADVKNIVDDHAFDEEEDKRADNFYRTLHFQAQGPHVLEIDPFSEAAVIMPREKW